MDKKDWKTDAQDLYEDVKDDLHHQFDDLKEEAIEEMAEFKQVGLRAWIKSNPATAAGIAVIGVLLVGVIIKAVF